MDSTDGAQSIFFKDKENPGRFKKPHTDICAQVLEFESSPSDDVSQAKDGTVRVQLLIITAFHQVGFVGRFENIGPSKFKGQTAVQSIFKCALFAAHHCFHMTARTKNRTHFENPNLVNWMKFLIYMVKSSAFVNRGSLKKGTHKQCLLYSFFVLVFCI